MQPALQTLSHNLQPLQASGSIPILCIEYFEIRPSNAPTGLTVLQYSRPWFADSIATNNSIPMETPTDNGAITPHCSRNSKCTFTDSIPIATELFTARTTGRTRFEKMRPKVLKESRRFSTKPLPAIRKTTVRARIAYLRTLRGVEY